MSKHIDESVRARGKITSFNISPKGHIEGMLVETKTGSIQINLQKHSGRFVARSTPVGSTIDLVVRLESGKGPNPVYSVDGEDAVATGTVVRLNYAIEGDVNGYHLDDGTFIHVKPKRAEKYQILVGETVRAIGSRYPGADAVVLEAHCVERVENTNHKRQKVTGIKDEDLDENLR